METHSNLSSPNAGVYRRDTTDPTSNKQSRWHESCQVISSVELSLIDADQVQSGVGATLSKHKMTDRVTGRMTEKDPSMIPPARA